MCTCSVSSTPLLGSPVARTLVFELDCMCLPLVPLVIIWKWCEQVSVLPPGYNSFSVSVLCSTDVLFFFCLSLSLSLSLASWSPPLFTFRSLELRFLFASQSFSKAVRLIQNRKPGAEATPFLWYLLISLKLLCVLMLCWLLQGVCCTCPGWCTAVLAAGRRTSCCEFISHGFTPIYILLVLQLDVQYLFTALIS